MPRTVGDGFDWQSGRTFHWNCSVPASLHPFRRPSAEDGGTFRWQLFDAGGRPLGTNGGTALVGSYEMPAARLDKREKPALVGSYESLAGTNAGGAPLDERGTGPEVLAGGSLAAMPAEPDRTFLVTFYRELRGMGLKIR